ncbi:MAG: biopolymer transporter ExbD [Pseudomonadota bacterium]
MRARREKPKREPTIALINIVFLMLVFFMVAGTLSQPLDGELKLVRTADLEGTTPPDTLVVHPDGRMSYRGETIDSAEEFYELNESADPEVARIVPDRDVAAATLVKIARALRVAGAQSVVIVTEKGLQ